MAIFYVLPPSPLVADHLADYLASWLPGLDWDEPTRLNLTEAIRAAATCRPDVYLVFREELPEGVATTEALVVRTDQGAVSLQIDMVADDDEIATAVGGIDASCSVG